MKRLSTPTSLRSLAWPVDTRLIARKINFFPLPQECHTETQIHKRKNSVVSNKWSGLAAFLSLEPWDFSPHSETTRQSVGTQGQQVAWPRKPDWKFYLFCFKDTDKAKSRDITKEITAHPSPTMRESRLLTWRVSLRFSHRQRCQGPVRATESRNKPSKAKRHQRDSKN